MENKSYNFTLEEIEIINDALMSLKHRKEDHLLEEQQKPLRYVDSDKVAYLENSISVIDSIIEKCK